MIRLYTFFIFSAIFVVLGYILFILPRHDHVSQTRLLIIPESAVTISYADNMINDIALIAQSAADADENAIAYDALVNVDRLVDHDIVDISIFFHSETNAIELQKSILKNILQEVDTYYSLSEDISVEVISQNHDLQKTTLATLALYILIAAIVLGVISGVFAIFYLIDRMREEQDHSDALDGKKIFEKYTDTQQKNEVYTMEKDADEDWGKVIEDLGDIEKKEDIEMKQLVKEKVIEDADEQVDEKKDEKIEQRDVMPSGLPTTPGNLPVIDVDNLGFGQSENENAEIENEKEPTEEELKARLNELLNGKL